MQNAAAKTAALKLHIAGFKLQHPLGIYLSCAVGLSFQIFSEGQPFYKAQ
jgi:hypothetical protein